MTIDRSVKLGIDTSTSAIAVAVSDGDETLVRERIDPLGHSEHLAPLIAEALQDKGIQPADLTVIAVGNGPGPFTGLRVGMVTGLTMGHALGIPVVGVCSLDVLAAQADAADGSEFLVASDARRKEVYWAVYAGARLSPSGSPIQRCPDPRICPSPFGPCPVWDVARSSIRTCCRMSTSRVGAGARMGRSSMWTPGSCSPWSSRDSRRGTICPWSRSTCADPTP